MTTKSTRKIGFGLKQVLLLLGSAVIVSGTVCGCSYLFANDNYQELKTFLSQGKYVEAIALCNEKLKASPSEPGLLGYRGVCEYRLKKFDEAEADLVKAISLDPKTGWYYREIGEVYLAKRKHKEALETLAKALEMNPDSDSTPVINSSLAVVHLRMDEPRTALIYADAALQKAPQQKYTYVTRSEAYAQLFELDKALADATKAVELDSKNPGAYLARAMANFYKGELPEATADARKALELDKEFWPALELEACISLVEGKFSESLEAADQMIKRYPDAAVGYANKSCCLFLKGEFSEAQKLADKALEVEPDSQRAIQVAALSAAKAGDKSKVKQLFDRIAEKALFSKLSTARSRAVCDILLGEYAEAVEALKELESQTEKMPNSYRVRSEAHRRLKQNELADSDLKKAVSQGYTKKSLTEMLLAVK